MDKLYLTLTLCSLLNAKVKRSIFDSITIMRKINNATLFIQCVSFNVVCETNLDVDEVNIIMSVTSHSGSPVVETRI